MRQMIDFFSIPLLFNGSWKICQKARFGDYPIKSLKVRISEIQNLTVTKTFFGNIQIICINQNTKLKTYSMEHNRW